MTDLTTFFSGKHTSPWQERLAFVISMMKDISSQADAKSLVAAYSRYMNQVMPIDRRLSLSRRGLPHGSVRITRSSTWTDEIDPWGSDARLPIFTSGLLSEMIYRDGPTVINDLQLDPNDPACEYLEGMGSLTALPLYDQGEALNMVVSLRRARDTFTPDTLPEYVWTANLFGRATHNLVLGDEVRKAYDAIDRELQTVAAVQHSLLPQELPKLATLEIAAHYVTSRWAGGDYYDFFPIDAHRCGILIADVSGHRTPAAVFMAVTHSLAHTAPDPADPDAFLRHINRGLCRHYTRETGRFVTAFYGVYDDDARTITFANAGHPPPHVRRSSANVFELDGNSGIPLGILDDETYAVDTVHLCEGDLVVLYTDGVTETRNGADELFGTERLDVAMMQAESTPPLMLAAVLGAMDAFRAGVTHMDDVTLLAARVR
ncbi:MAG TPA: PP2C family protein-serine/threonine phosphatase [Tepidisphaeraceae bacterium]|jgi:sigma-B regulation protein RsbU (phosphoserine phosphatase)|nr:PP2C family protein-serine/threonine phosphatase [Tepidisphaeraceae bacterium]